MRIGDLSLAAVVLLAGTALAQPDPEVDAKLPPPPHEVVGGKPGVNLPPQPAFEVPAPSRDGKRSARELRLRGASLLDTEIVLKGTVTWAYDCITANRASKESEAATRKRIEEDPTLCERPKFYVGDPGGRVETSVWVVDVPRPYNKMELTRLKKIDRTDPNKCEPGDAKKSICPPYKVGDVVEVFGMFTQQSPHSERNSDGLVVYKRMKNVTQGWETVGPAPQIAVARPVTRPAWTPPAALPIGKPKSQRVRKSALDASTRATVDGGRAYVQKQFEVAIASYQKAVALWPANHIAYYEMALTHAQRRDWSKAADAMRSAIDIDPTIAMYHLSYGRALYEKAIWQAREDAGRKQNRKPEEVAPDYATINFDKAFAELAQALRFDPDLWRAHYLLGKIHGHGDRPKESAGELLKAASYGPREAAPWVALVELYRAWDYVDQAIQIASQGATITSDSDVWLELGLAQDDKRNYKAAIEAYTKALDARADNHHARFGRGQAYFQQGDYANAKLDLEVFARSAGWQFDFFKQQASRMLMDIAAKPRRP